MTTRKERQEVAWQAAWSRSKAKAKRIKQARDALIEAVETWAAARKAMDRDGANLTYFDTTAALEAAHDAYREAIK